MNNLFASNGAHVLVDGQFGSTGKGVLAAWLAEQSLYLNVKFNAVISNAGPNSGHTFYHGDEKIILKQLPTFAVALARMGHVLPIILSAGAIIDVDILRKEALDYPGLIFVHPNAAVITQEDKDSEHSGTIAAVAGTRSGTGAALARKVQRDPEAVYGNTVVADMPQNVMCKALTILDWRNCRYFVEVSQGFSLGINQRFYPKCTSRECTVSQALADASLPPRSLSKSYMTVRTFPIRVGNVDGYSSGDWYYDQSEVSWDDLGQVPELTTVTQRERRIATFSQTQLIEAMEANDPDFVFVNFLNYLPDDPSIRNFMNQVSHTVNSEKKHYVGVIGSVGPKSGDVFRWT